MTTMKTTSEVESQVLRMMTDRAEVSVETVAEALASEIVTVQMDDLDTTDAVDAGVRAAIHEIDDTTFAFAVDVFRGRVLEEVEREAKRIALRLLRDVAAKAERAADACSPPGGF